MDSKKDDTQNNKANDVKLAQNYLMIFQLFSVIGCICMNISANIKSGKMGGDNDTIGILFSLGSIFITLYFLFLLVINVFSKSNSKNKLILMLVLTGLPFLLLLFLLLI